MQSIRDFAAALDINGKLLTAAEPGFVAPRDSILKLKDEQFLAHTCLSILSFLMRRCSLLGLCRGGPNPAQCLLVRNRNQPNSVL